MRNVKGFKWNHKRVNWIYNINCSLPSERVIRELKQIISWRGKPQL
jgi:hypothetical protein